MANNIPSHKKTINEVSMFSAIRLDTTLEDAKAGVKNRATKRLIKKLIKATNNGN